MADIELVIKMSEEEYKDVIVNGFFFVGQVEHIVDAIKNGTPLPKGHGKLVILSEDKLKENQINLDFSCQKWISEVDLSNATIAIIEADKGGAEWIDNKCSACGKGIEDLIESPEWYRNENPKYCPFCGRRIKNDR